ncbi:glycerate kinase [Bacillus sp. DTU_2020_1000418_1_SI_GHA_SEK_038]|uniref:glycerate kinase family protein n=1 Tax=Bacillus sp. DTU_2020_1000418_1_SI_GHA_SEK_038 TaxID=3077585 RepID=UPI0028E66D0C|nr:glycerate kinase [Bacillus sp. DTU_2020_1000418_1_SI_GHA_SEK_038]WNS73812.1 glycerate kinase [Bacillus sp. DTU_2020_1000418_1_SI_GHA_SEK_038]
MKIVIAPDSFKRSLTALEAAQAIEKGVKNAILHAETVLVPVADGGEGTMDSLVSATNGHKVEHKVKGPLLHPVQAAYGILGDQETCVIEMASASGLCLIDSARLNPMTATTFGTGQLIKKALDDGCSKFILAIGGSATNDGGVGMLQALGMKFLDANGEPVGYGGSELIRIAHIDDQEFDSRIANCEFLIATDVQNPLVGENGASFVFGPQKGATPEMVEILDNNLRHWADLVGIKTGIRLHDMPGAGAAGGIGGAFQAFFPSVTKRGIDLVIEYSGLSDHLADADCVFTGEGQIDFQTASGKTPMGVAEAAKIKGIPVFALTGSIGKGIDVLYEHGITSVHSIINSPITLQEAIANAAILLEQGAEQVMRTYLASN